MQPWEVTCCSCRSLLKSQHCIVRCLWLSWQVGYAWHDSAHILMKWEESSGIEHAVMCRNTFGRLRHWDPYLR